MNEWEGINNQLKNPVTRIFSLWKMGSSVVVLLFRDLPRFCPRPVSRSILGPFDFHWALWATEGEQQQLREEKRKMQKSFSLASPLVPLCNPAPVQSDLKEREGIGILLRGAIHWGADFSAFLLVFDEDSSSKTPMGPRGLWWTWMLSSKILSKFFIGQATSLLKSISHHWALYASRTKGLHSKWLIFIAMVSRSSKTFLSLSLFYCLCLWSDQ